MQGEKIAEHRLQILAQVMVAYLSLQKLLDKWCKIILRSGSFLVPNLNIQYTGMPFCTDVLKILHLLTNQLGECTNVGRQPAYT